jgi:hypothetical protein
MKANWIIVLSVMLIPVPSFGAGESHFRYSRNLDLGTLAGDQIISVPLDSSIYAATRDGFPDLRIRDDAGAEVPYLLEQVSERKNEHVKRICASDVLSLRELDGRALEIVVGLKEKAPNAGGMTILTPLANYEHRVKVFGTENGKDWSPLATDGLVFDYSRYMDVRNRDVTLPPNSFRKFKLEVEQVIDERESPFRELTRTQRSDGKDQKRETTEIERRPFRIDRIELWRLIEQQSAVQPTRTSYPIESFHVAEITKEKATRIDVWTRREPLTGFVIKTQSRNFSRTARVEAPVPHRVNWVEIGTGTINRFGFRGFHREDLQVDFPERRAEHYQIEIENADNPPLEQPSVAAVGNIHRIVFFASGKLHYRVEYGSDTAEAPRYDTAAVLASLGPGIQPVEAQLGPQVENPRYRGGRGWREWLASPLVLSLAIVLMVVVLGWMLFRAGKRLKQMPVEDI